MQKVNVELFRYNTFAVRLSIMKPHRSIAIVDDDPDDLMFIREALEGETKDFKILPFQSSVGFIDYLHSATKLPVLVVLDYNMPKMNAEDILIAMQSTEHLALVKTFILSTGMNPALKERLLSLGAHCCIAKPTSVHGYQTLAEDIILLATNLQEESKAKA